MLNRGAMIALKNFVLVLSASILLACSENDAPKLEEPVQNSTTTDDHSQLSDAPLNNTKAQTEFANKAFLDTLTALDALSLAVTQFTDTPNEQLFNATQARLTQAHNAYRVSSAFLALSPAHEASKFLDSYPLLPGYLDSVEGYPNSGIIHSEIPLNVSTLEDEFQFSDSMYLTLGFEAFAFILNGDPDSPVAPWRRFNDEGTDKNKHTAERRRQYLSLLSEHLVSEFKKQKLQFEQLGILNLHLLQDDAFKQAYLEAEAARFDQSLVQKISEQWAAVEQLKTEEAL
ncbi:MULTISPECIES: imelysin family protein [unclassified Oleiphilus]|uniref:imelysin family protein n=2 Tax=Oleiphilus TaxID=141450 RepID=UPI000ADA3505|nr:MULTISPECIES: imelysin family protein [unclassified Oleiphilus]